MANLKVVNAVSSEKPQKKNFRYHSLDFWRGVACLSVAAFHSIGYITENPAHTPGNALSHNLFVALGQGWAGVPLFFVISGYCIAAACESAMAKGMPAGTYFFRRFKRIYPPYWIFLLVVVALHFGFQLWSGADYLADNIAPMTKPWELSVHQWLGTFTLTEGWRDHLLGDPSRWFVNTAWSLGYEEQFYFVCGVAMLFGRAGFYRFLAALSGVVGVTALIHNFVTPLPIDGFFFDGRWLMFAAGVLVFYVVQFGGERSRKLALALLGAGFCLTLAWVFRQQVTIAKQILCSLPFAMLLIVLFKRDRQIAESRILRPITFCGVMCYSLYLIHYPVVKIMKEWLYRSAGLHGEWETLFITIPVCVVASVLVSWCFHWLVERRFLNAPAQGFPTGTKPMRSEPLILVNAQTMASDIKLRPTKLDNFAE